MKYMLLIYPDFEALGGMSQAEMGAHFESYFAFNAVAAEKTTILGGESLTGADATTVVRQRDGKTVTTDGPFMETKEQIGGYYLIDAKDLDEAIEIAGMIPDAKYGAIEIRPVQVFEEGLDAES